MPSTPATYSSAEVALAKRIEAGRQTMLDGLRESPLTMRAVLAWRDAIRAGSMALREVIDIEATHRQRPGGDGGRRERRPWISEWACRRATGEGCQRKRR